MKAGSGNAAIPDLLLERYRVGEVSAAERVEVERRLREDEALRGRLSEIERSDAAIRATEFTSSLAAHVATRAAAHGNGNSARRLGAGKRRASTNLLRWALPLAVGVTAMVVVVIGSRTRTLSPAPSEERIKGLRPSLSVFRQTPDGSERLVDGVAVREGDLLRLAYQSAGQTYGVIVSIDGRGGVTLHLPKTGTQATHLRPGDKVLLDTAYELDDAPRWECFYFVTGKAPFAVRPVVDAATREAALRRASPPSRLGLAPGLEQSTFVLKKEP